MLNMLKVHGGGGRETQGPGNRIGTLSAGSPGLVIAGTERCYQTTSFTGIAKATWTNEVKV